MKTGLYIIAISFIWSLAETFVFLIEYGWHYHAINSAEEQCDGIAGIGFIIGCTFVAFGFSKLIKQLEK